jgi:hypothetical protein
VEINIPSEEDDQEYQYGGKKVLYIIFYINPANITENKLRYLYAAWLRSLSSASGFI